MDTSSKKYKRSVFKEGDTCVYCKRKMSFPNSIEARENPGSVATIEHYFYPQSRGGTNEPYNIRFACYFCNNLRGDMPIAAFEKFARVIIRKYPHLSTITIRNCLKKYTMFLVEVASRNNQELNKAASLSLLSLVDDGFIPEK